MCTMGSKSRLKFTDARSYGANLMAISQDGRHSRKQHVPTTIWSFVSSLHPPRYQELLQCRDPSHLYKIGFRAKQCWVVPSAVMDERCVKGECYTMLNGAWKCRATQLEIVKLIFGRSEYNAQAACCTSSFQTVSVFDGGWVPQLCL